MIISKKKYEKLNNDLVEAKAKIDDAKKALDDENKIMRVNLLIKEQRDDYKTQRDTLIDDIAVLKANISRLERENGHKDDVIRWNSKRIEDLKFENKKFKRIAKNLAGDSYKYTTLTNHIRLKAEVNPSVDRYIELKNFITRLEKGE